MKILHILNELKFSGAEIMYVSAAPEFEQLDCELYVVNTSSKLGTYTPYFKKANYTVLHWPCSNKKQIWDKLGYIKNAIFFIKENNIDVIHIHRSDMKLIMSYIGWKTNCKCIYTFHNVFPSKWYSYFYHIIQRWWIKTIFHCKFQSISDSVYNHEKTYYLNKTTKIYNWYNYHHFYPAKKVEKDLIRKELNIGTNTLVIISVGGCSPIKRHTEIIQALPTILSTYPDTIYLHLGEGESLNQEIELAKELKVDKHIRFEGNQTNVRKYLIASDLYLMTSIHEGISLTTIEALACKIPAILYNVPGLKDFNKEKPCSLLIKEDFQTLARTIIKLFQDNELKNTLSTNGEVYVNKYFNMTTNVKKIFSLYQ